MIDSIQSLFSLDTLEELARSTKFVQRLSVLTPEKFLDILFKDASTESGMSLRDYSNELASTHKVSISAQGISERFNDYAVKFLKTLLGYVFTAQISRSIDDSFLKSYTSVRVWDSTKLELPQHMKTDFPGFGGSASQSGMSVQFRYDLKNRTGSSLELYPATFSDAHYTRETEVEENSLEIFDLGYVNADFLIRLQEGGSHYVCRLHTRTTAYQTDGTPIDFEREYKNMSKHNISVLEKNVLVGQKRFAARMVLSLVDEQTYQMRIRKLQKESKEKGLSIRDQTKIRLRFNIMLTNTDPEVIPTQKVYLLYKFRWQIELFFKNWKSSGWNIDKIKDVKYERYMCILYAKLMMIVLSDRIHSHFARQRYAQDKKLLSPCKCVKTLRQQIDLLRSFINADVKMLFQIFDKIGMLFSRGHILCKRKKRINYQDLFDLFIVV